MDKLEQEGKLDPDEGLLFARMRADSYLYRQQYEQALVEYRKVLGDFDPDPRERKRIEELVKRLEGMGGHQP
jgi:DNA/RNA-binding domain of Phe-tRNA-synthetase-like protein